MRTPSERPVSISIQAWIAHGMSVNRYGVTA
jgi:hypothetical protein